ncbi:peptidoglycan-binding protein [Ruegeria sp. 2012CJ41-6]|uniref:Peptidoglycan-binding protein n=1 Tax=Ruegeria spongiae TaxID=2942209 RepID=A0ABT0Q276_9RHOB|nr:peptidoglycan-binding domain-containing protein [Ruegeria spongiae]MCL6283935.1 peptidoglycan-binding protein [Ruegeria spongiae]
MYTKHICMAVLASSVALIPAKQAPADEAAALIGGALLGGIIVNEVHKNKQRQRASTQRQRSSAPRYSGISSAQRQQNRDVQAALNYFGYNVGVVDGSLGRNSRAGISRFQADMGYPIDGYLNDYERSFLLNSQQRALASAHVAPYNQIVATQGQGGLLRTYRNEQLGIQTPQVQPATVPAPAAPAPTPAPAPAPAPAATPVKTDDAELPDFTFGQTARSPNEHCNEVNVLTAANGGLTQSGQVSDPEFALNEQFCVARTQAMAQSSRLEATIPNMTSAQIQAQCDGLAQAIAPQLKGIDSQPPARVIAKTKTFLEGSGRSMEQLQSAGEVCLGIGYRTDAPKLALASAVLLTATGELGYGEMVSHQLREGFGVAKPTGQQAAEWMKLAVSAAQNGGAVLGQNPDRLATLSAATNGAGTGTAALPIFPTTGN